MFLTALNLPAQAVQAPLQFPDNCPGEHIAQFVGYVGKVGVKRRLPFPSFKVVVFQQAQVEYFINVT